MSGPPQAEIEARIRTQRKAIFLTVIGSPLRINENSRPPTRAFPPLRAVIILHLETRGKARNLRELGIDKTANP